MSADIQSKPFGEMHEAIKTRLQKNVPTLAFSALLDEFVVSIQGDTALLRDFDLWFVQRREIELLDRVVQPILAEIPGLVVGGGAKQAGASGGGMPTRSTLAVRRSAKAKRRKALLEPLLRAVAFCAIAQLPLATPQSGLLNAVRGLCDRHDELAGEFKEKDEARRRLNACAGRMRHNSYRRLGRLVPRLLRTKAPKGGWISRRHAGETLAPHLVRIARKRRFPVSSDEETWTRNVCKLISQQPQAREVFERHRSPDQQRRRKKSSRLPKWAAGKAAHFFVGIRMPLAMRQSATPLRRSSAT